MNADELENELFFKIAFVRSNKQRKILKDFENVHKSCAKDYANKLPLCSTHSFNTQKNYGYFRAHL